MAQSDSHPRLILHNFLPLDLCKELEFIHKSCSTVGYRPNVFSTTLSHLIATNSAHLILPFVSIRERLKEKAEEFFGCEYELFIEFTGLISWTKGSSIGWHSDDNRPYLKQRAFAAVCYLNSHGEEFEGGLFHFQDGEPKTIVPVAGDVVMYTADSRNIHSVDKIIEGERLTLTLWFTRESSHDEDSKLISLLSQTLLRGPLEESVSYLPLPAPSNMYLFSPEQFSDGQLGFDIRLARVNVLGFTFYFLDDKNLTEDPACHSSEPLMQPLLLAREGQIFYKEFVNSLHALQVVQFYCWKVSEHQASDSMSGDTNVLELIISCPEESYSKKSVCPDDLRLAEMVFCSVAYNVYRRSPFNWEKFSAVVAAWEGYSCQLHRKLYASLPYWKTHQSIFSVPLFGLKKDTL